MKNSVSAARFPFCSAKLITFTLNSCITVILPQVCQNRQRLEAKLNTGNTIIKEVMSLPLLQVAGGNPTFLKDKRSDGLPTSEI
jgi:hypothetical protein